jgi:CubicO group peptidase (beta-lactamase class C family)
MISRHMRVITIVLTVAVAGCGVPAPTPAPTVAPAQPKHESPTATLLPPTKQSPTSTVVPPTQTSPPPTSSPTAAPLEAYWPTKSWRTSTPEEQGMDSANFVKLAGNIPKMWSDYDSVLVVRHGYVVFELYRNKGNPDTKQNIRLVTASALSVLFGIAMDEKKVALNQKMLDFFPTAKITTDLERKKDITLENLLSRTTLMDYSEWDFMNGPVAKSDDWLLYALNTPLVGEPGKLDASSVPSFILAGVLQQATKTDLLDYANAKLFAPLGIMGADWEKAPGGVRRGEGGLMLSARDLAKIGLLMVRDGKWEDRQVVSSDWVKRSTCQVITNQVLGESAYVSGCYNWLYSSEKTKPSSKHTTFWGIEAWGQTVIGIPELDLVVVTTSHLDKPDELEKLQIANQILSFFVVPSIKSDTPLPPNPTAYAQLQEKVKQGK